MELQRPNTAGGKALTFIKSPVKAALHCKCPRCRTGTMFSDQLYGFHGQRMNKVCENCGFTFEIEPGYFYVAMFVSYAMNVAEMVIAAVLLYFFTGSNSPWLYCAVLIGLSFVLSPIHFRYSRVILLYWLTPGVHFDPKFVPTNLISSDRPKTIFHDC